MNVIKVVAGGTAAFPSSLLLESGNFQACSQLDTMQQYLCRKSLILDTLRPYQESKQQNLKEYKWVVTKERLYHSTRPPKSYHMQNPVLSYLSVIFLPLEHRNLNRRLDVACSAADEACSFLYKNTAATLDRQTEDAIVVFVLYLLYPHAKHKRFCWR